MPAGVAGTDLAVSGLVRNELTVDGTERGCKLGTVWQKFGKKICTDARRRGLCQLKVPGSAAGTHLALSPGSSPGTSTGGPVQNLLNAEEPVTHVEPTRLSYLFCTWWRAPNLCFTETPLNTDLADVPLQVTHPGKTCLDYYRNDSTVLSLYGNPGNDTDFTCDKRQVRQFARAFLPACFWLIFSVGAVGNALVVVIYCKYRFRRSMMDRYLLHLAIADLLLLFTLPFWAKAASDGWVFKNFMCKVVNSMYKINFYGCSLFLTCISFDRYITIVQATKAKTSKRRRLLRSKLMCLAVWLTSVSLCIPEIMYSQSTQVGDVTVCKITYPPDISMVFRVTVLALKVTIGFFLPLLVMVICYTLIINTLLQTKRSQKQKSLKIITLIVTAFLLSQFPYNIVLLVKAINTYARVAYTCQADDRLGSRGEEQSSSACDSQEHSSNWSFAMLGRRRVRSSLILSTHLTSSISSPPCQVLL
nr:PREDICTED: C-C chemokine receptor type 9 [Opisthocomus hoazin]